MTSEREITAIHEAGHCLVAERLGYRVKKAWINPEDNELGEYSMSCLSRLKKVMSCFSNPEEFAMTAISGNITQKYFFPDSKILPADDRQLNEIIKSRSNVWLRHIDIDKAENALRKILSDNRNITAIKEIAQILCNEGSITGQKVREIIARIDA